jgi:hypothetical protein
MIQMAAFLPLSSIQVDCRGYRSTGPVSLKGMAFSTKEHPVTQMVEMIFISGITARADAPYRVSAFPVRYRTDPVENEGKTIPATGVA